jgi:hypothetical protein
VFTVDVTSQTIVGGYGQKKLTCVNTLGGGRVKILKNFSAVSLCLVSLKRYLNLT